MTSIHSLVRQQLLRYRSKTVLGASESPPQSLEWNGLTPGVGAGLMPNVRPEAFALLRTMFTPSYYSNKHGITGLTNDALFVHFLREGFNQGASPSPLFQNKVVEKLIPPKSGKSKDPSLLRWLHHPDRSSIVPTHRFDAEYYLTWNRDVAEEGFPPFEHYLRFGLAEGRNPNAIFDRLWYEELTASEPRAQTLPSYIHYLCEGLNKGMPPRQILYPIFMHRAPGQPVADEQFDDFLIASRYWLANYGIHKYVILLGLFLSYSYDGKGALSEDADGIARLIHFLNVGAAAGLDPGPMFSSSFYSRRLGFAETLSIYGSAPLLHFLAEGVHKRIVPTPIFDNDNYCRAHPDIRESKLWGFEHFIVFGIFEGRSGQSAQQLSIASRPANRNDGLLGNWRNFWARHDERVPQDLLPKGVPAMQRKVTEILNSEVFANIMKRAIDIEPELGEFRDIHEILAPPLHDPREQVRAALQSRLGEKYFHTVITVPWIRNGGADLVACLLAKAVVAARPGEKVLLLRVDQPNYERGDWVPPGVETVDISDLLNSLPLRERQFLLYSVFEGMAPSRIINVNSRTCWTVFRRFGRRLKPRIKLYAYLFCWDQTPSGARAGYPSEFYPSTANIVDGIFTDTEYLRRELIRIYRPPAVLQNRLHTLYSPTQSAETLDIAARAALATARERPMVLWGGRLDRQKRFDLVQAVARTMPHVDFLCWGVAVLDASPDLSKSPPNLILHQEFRGFDDLPLRIADLWLYTSAWDGMPTTLIELGKRGVSVVASSVGGVPELIDETTGWPVADIESVEAYVDAIQQALAQPDTRIERAERLKQRVAERYTEARYVRKVEEILGG